MESVSGTPSPGQLGHEAILEATLRCLREEGYDATTIRRIAKQLNCAIGSIYRYFKDKRELLLAVTQRLIEPVAVDLEDGGPFEASVDAFIRLAKADCEPYRLMFWLSCSDDPQIPSVVTRIINAWAKRLGSEVQARQCWAMMHGSIIAGLDPQAIRTAVLNMAGHRPDQSSMAQIVTMLKEPPRRPALAGDQSSAPATTADSTDAQSVPVKSAEQDSSSSDDVCLL